MFVEAWFGSRKNDVRNRCKKLTLRAGNDDEAALLALIYRAFRFATIDADDAARLRRIVAAVTDEVTLPVRP